MNKLTTKGMLIVDTIEIAERTGRFELIIAIDGYSENCNYYAEFETANVLKTMSGPIVPITGGGGYVIAVPTAVSHYVGDVFMQIVSYSRASGELISRSLVSNRAAFCVVKSILAEESIPSKEKDDYMSRLEKLLVKNENVLCEFDSRLEKLLADNETAQSEFDLRLEKSIVDNETVQAEFNLRLEKSIVDNETAQSEFDLRLEKSIVDNEIVQAEFDLRLEKSIADNEIVQAEFDLRLEKSIADNETVQSEFDLRLEKSIVDNETVQAEFDIKLDQLDGKHVAKSIDLSGMIALVDTKADNNSTAISAHRTATRLAPVVIYDRNTKNIINNTTYNKVLPQTITIDLNNYKMLSFYMQYYEYQIVLKTRLYEPYSNIIKACGHFAGAGNTDEFNCEVEYNRTTKGLKYKLVSKKYANGNFVYVNIVMDTVNAGLTRIEGCVNSI